MEKQILTVIDCQSILTNQSIPKGSIGSETNLGSYAQSDAYVYMIGSGDYLASNQGKSELNIGAHSGDIVQWTVTDPTSGQEYNPVLYGFTTGQATAVTAPVMINETVDVFQPASTNAPTGPFTSVTYSDYVWQSTVVQPGVQVQYSWKFVILDNNGTQLGAYSWDPFITVS
ncbi:MAG TPA: AidA/PixA family protein [Thermoanaerobaculia bacterium]|nr:AidA/PixA family protein [Thermoanaerobaculia bacterium]